MIFAANKNIKQTAICLNYGAAIECAASLIKYAKIKINSTILYKI